MQACFLSEYIWLHNRLQTNQWTLITCLGLLRALAVFLFSFAPAVNYMTQEIIQNWSISNSFFSCIHLKIQLPMWIPSFLSDSWNFLSLFCDHVAFLSWLTSTISVLCMWQHLNYYHKLWFVSINETKVNKTLSLG